MHWECPTVDEHCWIPCFDILHTLCMAHSTMRALKCMFKVEWERGLMVTKGCTSMDLPWKTPYKTLQKHLHWVLQPVWFPSSWFNLTATAVKFNLCKGAVHHPSSLKVHWARYPYIRIYIYSISPRGYQFSKHQSPCVSSQNARLRYYACSPFFLLKFDMLTKLLLYMLLQLAVFKSIVNCIPIRLILPATSWSTPLPQDHMICLAHVLENHICEWERRCA